MGWPEQRKEDRDCRWCRGRGPHCYWCGCCTAKDLYFFERRASGFLDTEANAYRHSDAYRHSNANTTADIATNRPSNSAADTATVEKSAAERRKVRQKVPEHIGLFASSAGDGFSVSDATVAVDSLNADWNAEAVKSAKNYLSISGYSCKGLIDQIER